MVDMHIFIQWARTEQSRISQEAMQKRQQMETLLNRMNLELGEANGRMKMLDDLIQQAETGSLAGQGIEAIHERDIPHTPPAPVDTNQ